MSDTARLNPIADAERKQRDAADPNACVWLAASAGTGKTKALTDRVLSLLLSGTEPHRILCLTFTRAAAAEMAIRIGRSLSAWALAGDLELKDALTNLTGTPPSTKETARARRLFAEVLDAPGGLRIATIHAFCESVLKRFPVEAGLAPHFEVIDERTARELLEKARDEVLSRAREGRVKDVSDGALAEAFACIAQRANEEQFGDLMMTLAREHGRLGALLAELGGVEGLTEKLAEALDLAPGDDETAILKQACADAAFDQLGLTRVCKELAKGAKTDQDRARQIVTFLESAAERRHELFAAYMSAFLTQDGTIRARLATNGVLQKLGSHADALAGEADRILAVVGRVKAARLLVGTKAALTLGAALLESYVALKDARAALDYDDLILKTRALLTQPGISPWVLFKLDGLDHVLIDEAQDTSADQWAVIAALTDEFFAGAGARDAVRTVFAVGDAKQSIYSFQRADPEAFAKMREYFRARAIAARRTWRDLALDVSFRSVAPVLKAVDGVFSLAPASDGVSEDGTPVRHRAARAGQAGRVELWPLVSATRPDPAERWQPPLAASAQASASSILAAHIAQTIKDWIDRREVLLSCGRPIRPSDVMILVRQRTGFMEALVTALKACGVPVAGVDRMVLTDQLVVQDLMALARFLLLPEDDLNLAALLKSPLVGFDEEALFKTAHGRPATLWGSLRKLAVATPGSLFATAEARLSAWLARADFLRPFDLFARILYAEGGRARLLARLGPEADDPLSEFLALALAYERAAVPSLQDFVAWIEAGEAEIKRDLENPVRDEVRVMTVHGAKGLQAPIVFLPDTTQVPGDRERLVWIDDAAGSARLPLWVPRTEDDDPVSAKSRTARVARTEREHHRLLYVAMTRAEDRLVVAGYRPRTAKKDAVPEDAPAQAERDCWYDRVQIGLALAEGVREERFSDGAFDRPKLVLASEQEVPPQAKKTTAVQEAPAAADERLPSWLESPGAAEPQPSRPLTPSRFVGDDGAEAAEPAPISPLAAGGERFRRGIVVHRLLQLLPQLPAAARASRAEDLIAGMGLPAEEAERTLAEVERVISAPDLAALFAPGSLAEVPFAGRLGEGGPEIVGRFDRLAVGDTEVIVADYKTNRPVPKDTVSVPEPYLRQMALYRAALLNAFPGRVVRCVLVYTDGPRVIELPAAALDRIIARVSAAPAAHGSLA
ncbi:MAG TPA: double-strand break repair helicase AddA [Alphaproteobacteria bacterium]|nr:double-strand break repair helicase AddA [Alphaproteobacteria bacterium]